MDRQNYIELVSVPFQAGESKLFAISGQYFELIDAVNPVDVVLTDKYGAQRGLMRQAEASFNLKATEFATVQLTSATAQTVRFAYGTGEGGTRRAAGSVNIANQPTVVLQAADMALIRRPELPAANWNSLATLAANTPVTIFAAGANPNGAIVWSMEADETVTGANNMAFIAKATAPTSVNDGEIIAHANLSIAATNNVYRIRREEPTRIAAGLGLYLIATAAGSANQLKNCRYSLL